MKKIVVILCLASILGLNIFSARGETPNSTTQDVIEELKELIKDQANIDKLRGLLSTLERNEIFVSKDEVFILDPEGKLIRYNIDTGATRTIPLSKIIDNKRSFSFAVISECK